MVTLPPDMPVTTPVVEPTVAMAVLPEVHVPPGAVLLSVIVMPAHTLVLPVMPGGAGVTVTIAVILQPAGEV